MIVVAAPRCTLLRVTEDLGLCKTYQDGNMTAFSFEDRDTFCNIGEYLINKMVTLYNNFHLCTALPGKQLFLTLQKQHLVPKNEFAFSFRPMHKSKFSQACSGNMLIFNFDVNMKRLGIRFENDSFQ